MWISPPFLKRSSSLRGFTETSMQEARSCLGGFTMLQEGLGSGIWVGAGEAVTGAQESLILSCPHLYAFAALSKVKTQTVCISRFRLAMSPKTSAQAERKSSKAERVQSLPRGVPQDALLRAPAQLCDLGWWLTLAGPHLSTVG